MYSSLLHVKDWDYVDSMFFLATFQLVETITVSLFSTSFSKWHQHINTGSLDLILTKPTDTQTMLSLNAISFPQLLTILAPLSLLIGLAWQYTIFPSTLAIFFYILAIPLAVSIFYSVWLILMTMLFWLGGITQWHQLFNGLTAFLQVPPVVYQGIIKFVFYFILPIFTAVVLPIETVWQNSPYFLAVLSATSICLLIISRWLFCWGLKSYNSASS